MKLLRIFHGSRVFETETLRRIFEHEKTVINPGIRDNYIMNLTIFSSYGVRRDELLWRYSKKTMGWTYSTYKTRETNVKF